MRTPDFSRGTRSWILLQFGDSCNSSLRLMKSVRLRGSDARAAFTLLEVMIALSIFFIAMFAILDLTGRCLKSAHALQQPIVDATSLAAELSMTNRLEEGVESGDFGDLYPGYTWTRAIYQVRTNGLFQVDFAVVAPAPQARIDSQMSILLYRPDSAQPGRTLSPRNLR